MAIRNNTARELLYSWHGGQWSAFYAAASSGLVESFVALSDECCRHVSGPDRQKLMQWMMAQQAKAKRVTVQGREYSALPWAKSYK